ncbi:MAG: hypothetical protein E7559_10515 [Ruminococcaceae bacterium]|nr:hypothetical protein [Oscillospiraceae bacterium]
MFYENLVEVCKELGVYPTRVVLECGGKSGSISGWKKGAWPSSEIVANIASHLNISCDRLLLGKPSTQPTTAQNASYSEEAQQLMQLFDSLDQEGRIIVMAEALKQKQRLGD